MRLTLAAALLALLPCVCHAQPGAPTPTPTPTPAQRPAPPPPPSWWEKILIVAGVITTPGGQKGEKEPPRAGNIFIVNLKANFELASARQLTTGGGFRSPVILAGGTRLLALKGEKVVRVAVLDGAVEEVAAVPGIYKLVGQSAENPDDVLALVSVGGEDCTAVAMFSLRTKQLTLIPRGNTDADEAALGNLIEWERVYGGGVTLKEKVEATDNAGRPTQTNVFLLRPGAADVKLSDCDGKN
ncbi:MAG TPA: hypothetical protein VNZ44_17195, partial [Pyrinomonadaceae bacterium]|nr:hypothetical protein [Pyrinomonadaceae bacterium]